MSLDKLKIKHAFSNASNTYDSVAQLQREVGCDLLTQFLSKKLTGNVIDIGCGTGFLTQALLPDCENVNLIALDLALPMLRATREKLVDSVSYVCADAENLPFAKDSIDTLLSNVALQWCQPIDGALNELQRILNKDCTLIFSTFGSQTLCELKTAWASVDDFPHVNTFYNAQQLQQSLQKAGFNHLEIKVQQYLPRYESVLDLMRELKHIGAHNVHSARSRHLTTKTALQTMIENYPRTKSGEIVATFEVIFVKAKK